MYVIKYAIFSQGEIIYIEYARKKFNFDIMFAVRPVTTIFGKVLEYSVKCTNFEPNILLTLNFY